MRSFATLILSLTMAVAALGLAVAAPGRDQEFARAELENASGALRIANSRAGQAVFTATAMRPGTGVSGTVRIGNDGDIAGRFGVRTTGVQDDPGPYGGLLSERADVVLFDVTSGRPVTVFAGRATDFDDVDLGTFAAGESRDYVVAVTLADGGVDDDNTYQGSGFTLGFEWRAGTVAAPTPTQTPAPTATPAPAAPTPPPVKPTVPVDFADALGLPTSTKCVARGRLKFRLKAPGGARVVSATVAVNGRVKARVKGAKVRKPVTLRGLRKSAKLKVTVRASTGRVYTARRTYRGCRGR